ncbi:MAG: MarR family winged helix-turn-helix transcriptional regulator [Vicinamibacterales bacterium]
MGTNISAGRETQQVLDSIRRIVQALRESSRLAERRVGLTSAQLFVLQKLAESPASSVNGLAARTHTHQSSVSVVVARLVEQGLVRRAPSAVDGRSVELTLSSRGRRTAADAPDLAQARLIDAIERLTATRRRHLASTLGEVTRALAGSEAVPAMFFEEGRPRARRTSRA